MIKAVGAVLLLALFFGVGVRVGLGHKKAQVALDVVTTAERDARITAAIVKVNPGASIRDFGGDFPRFLVAAADLHGIDFRLVMAVVEKESAWNPRAVGAAGEIGLMQMLPATAAEVTKRMTSTGAVVHPDHPNAGAVEYTPPTRLRGGYSDLGSLGDPRASVRLGLAYLAMKVQEYGVGPNATALRAYNRAPGKARESRPHDRYAEDIAIRFVSLVHQLPR